MGPLINFRAPSRWRASGPLEVSSKSPGSVTFYTVLKKKSCRVLNKEAMRVSLQLTLIMNIGALPRWCHPKVTRIGTHGLLHSRSAMPWRLTRDLISVVSRTELTSRGSSKPRTLCRTSHTFDALANFARLGTCAANKTQKD